MRAFLSRSSLAFPIGIALSIIMLLIAGTVVYQQVRYHQMYQRELQAVVTSTYLNRATAGVQNDVWIAGCGFAFGKERGTITHVMDGQATSIFGPPNDRPYCLYNIAMLSANDGWARGATILNSQVDTPIAFHFDGHTWSPANPPDLDGAVLDLQNTYGLPWSSTYDDRSHQWHLVRWDGKRWNIVDIPLIGHEIVQQTAMFSAREGYVVALAVTETESKTRILHYLNGTWTEDYHTTMERGGITSFSVASDGDAWAVITPYNYTPATVLHRVKGQWQVFDHGFAPATMHGFMVYASSADHPLLCAAQDAISGQEEAHCYQQTPNGWQERTPPGFSTHHQRDNLTFFQMSSGTTAVFFKTDQTYLAYQQPDGTWRSYSFSENGAMVQA